MTPSPVALGRRVPRSRLQFSNLRPLAVRVARDGGIDLGSSALGSRVYGEWPRSAWLQTTSDTDPTAYEFSHWNGSVWVKDALLQTAMAVMTGSLAGQSGYTVVAGATTAVLRNSVGSSIAAVSSSCDRSLLSQWIVGGGETTEARPRAIRIGEGRMTPGEPLPAEPAQLAIDPHCHEWLVSSDGALFEKESPSAGWQKRSLASEGTPAPPTAIAATRDRIWIALGPALFAVRAGRSERVDLPLSLGPQGAAIFLASDEQGDRLWAAVTPVNERGTILTTGPVPEKMRCDLLAKKIGTK